MLIFGLKLFESSYTLICNITVQEGLADGYKKRVPLTLLGLQRMTHSIIWLLNFFSL
jgi:hypothetical protein